uniref:Uncharacterized protein n=1 Tax=Arundo donax TaxID=35708 RepID=A0A0A8ZH97_ARUDO
MQQMDRFNGFQSFLLFRKKSFL